MKINKILLIGFIISMLCNKIVLCQYDITFEIKDSKDDTLILGCHSLDNLMPIDTATNKNGKFIFKNKKKPLQDGMYFITNNKKVKICNFVLQEDRNLVFKTTDDNWNENLQVGKNKNISQFLEYNRLQEKTNIEYNELMKQKNQLDSIEFRNKMLIWQDKNNSLKIDFINKYPNHLFSKILLCSKPIEKPSFPTIFTPDGNEDTIQMRKINFNYYKQHYFDNIDLSCGALLRTPKDGFYNHYTKFWENVMKYENTDTILYYADFYLSKATDKQMFDFMVYDITSRYLSDGIMGHERIYVEMVNRYFKTGKYNGLSPVDMEKNIIRADKWSNLLIGKTIPDLACPEKEDNSTWHHLNELKNKYKILVFWSVDCGHCTTAIPKLAEFYKQYKKTYDVEIFAVHTEGNLLQMYDFLKKYDIEWINTNGLIANYDWRDYFDIEKTPVLYILDTNNKILAKNIPVQSLKQVMDILENGGFDI